MGALFGLSMSGCTPGSWIYAHVGERGGIEEGGIPLRQNVGAMAGEGGDARNTTYVFFPHQHHYYCDKGQIGDNANIDKEMFVQNPSLPASR